MFCLTQPRCKTSLEYVLIAVARCTTVLDYCSILFFFFFFWQQYTEIIETQKFNKIDASSILDHEYVSQKFTFLVSHTCILEGRLHFCLICYLQKFCSYVFWFGDLNFRIDNVKNDDIRKKAKDGDYDPLLQHDQVKLVLYKLCNLSKCSFSRLTEQLLKRYRQKIGS